MAGFEDDGADDAFMSSLFDELDRQTQESIKAIKPVVATASSNSTKLASESSSSSSTFSNHLQSHSNSNSNSNGSNQLPSCLQSRPSPSSSSCFRNQHLETRQSPSTSSRSTVSNQDQLAAQDLVMMDHDISLQADLDSSLDADMQRSESEKATGNGTQSLSTPSRQSFANGKPNGRSHAYQSTKLTHKGSVRPAEGTGAKGKESKQSQKDYLGWTLDDNSSEARAARAESRSSSRTYTRCLVKKVFSRRYSPGASNPNQTATSTSTKQEKVLDLEVLEKIDNLEETHSLRGGENSSAAPSSDLKGKGKEESNSSYSSDGKEKKKRRMRALLRGEWIQTNAQVGDILNLIGQVQSILDVDFDLKSDEKPELNREPSPPSSKKTFASPSKGRLSTDIRVKEGEEDDLWSSMDFQEESMLNEISLSQGSKADQKSGIKKQETEDDDLWKDLDSEHVDFGNISSQPTASQSSKLKARPKVEIESEDSSNYSPQLVPVPTLILSLSKEHSENLLILHPDVLVPATKLSDVASCMRRPLIQDRMRGAGSEDVGVGLVMGNLSHEVLQACLTGKGAEVTDQDRLLSKIPTDQDIEIKEEAQEDEFESQLWNSVDREENEGQSEDELSFPNEWPPTSIGNFSLPFVRAQVRFQIKKNLSSLINCGLSDTGSAVRLLMDTVKGYGWFAKLYLSGADPKHQGVKVEPGSESAGVRKPFQAEIPDEATVHDARATVPARVRLRRILDVEEDIWSPMYGLKGKVDVSVEVELIEQNETLAKTGAIGAAFRRASTAKESLVSSESRSSPVGFGSGLGNRAQSDGRYLTPAERRQRDKEESQVKRVAVMPLELKTGRSISGMEHRAQTMLYTLMMSDRYGTDVTSGLLYYSKVNELHRVRRSLNEVRGLIIGRNEMAGYLVRRPFRDASSDVEALATNLDAQLNLLPPTIDNERACGRCYAVDGCMLYRKAIDRVEEDKDDPSEIAQIYNDRTSHLTPKHLDFFQKWEALLTLEENDITRFRRELWIWTSKVREQAGRCFSEMVIAAHQASSDEKASEGADPVPKENRSMNVSSYVFVRSCSASSLHGSSLLNGYMTKNDPVTISIEPGLLSVAQGFIIDLTPESVTVGLDHSLDSAIDRALEQSGRDVTGGRSEVVFRIDRDELSAGMGRIRLNLARLFFADSSEGRHQISDPTRRELIVDLRPPQFKSTTELEEEYGELQLPSHLNQDQAAAMRKILSAKDYALILGMPGTGKTTTIAELIKLLARCGKSVLLTSYTHSAVDTILRKLSDVNQEGDLEILRLGNADKVHQDVRPFILGQGPKRQAETVEQLEDQLMSPNVVATTCLSVGHPIFSKRKFDYCIVDEASQITLPTCLGPLRFANTFILVGDHFQLPPLVRNSDARKGGLDTSLFKILADEHPQSVVELTRQYRMNKEIMTLSNHLIYDGKLKCGNQEVSELKLTLPKKDELEEILHAGSNCQIGKKKCWLEKLMDESCKAVFVDTGGLSNARESKVGDLVQNLVEANLVEQISKAFMLGGIKGDEIGVISPYRQQIKLLTHLLHPIQKAVSVDGADLDASNLDLGQDTSSIEIFTADRSQGRDKSVILISLVRSNRNQKVGELLRDWRRINVAFTRAKKKLIVIGDKETLREAEMLSDFLALMDQNGWVMRLKDGDDSLHQGIGNPVKVEEAKDAEDERTLMDVDQGGNETSEVSSKENRPSTPTSSQRKRKAISSSSASVFSPISNGSGSPTLTSKSKVSSDLLALAPNSTSPTCSAPTKRSRSWNSESVSDPVSSCHIGGHQSQPVCLNSAREVKRTTISKEALLKRRPVLKDVLRENGVLESDG